VATGIYNAFQSKPEDKEIGLWATTHNIEKLGLTRRQLELAAEKAAATQESALRTRALELRQATAFRRAEAVREATAADMKELHFAQKGRHVYETAPHLAAEFVRILKTKYPAAFKANPGYDRIVEAETLAAMVSPQSDEALKQAEADIEYDVATADQRVADQLAAEPPAYE
jgi:hypothetical protein